MRKVVLKPCGNKTWRRYRIEGEDDSDRTLYWTGSSWSEDSGDAVLYSEFWTAVKTWESLKK